MLSSSQILGLVNQTVNRNFWLFASGSVKYLIIRGLSRSAKYVTKPELTNIIATARNEKGEENKQIWKPELGKQVACFCLGFFFLFYAIRSIKSYICDLTE